MYYFALNRDLKSVKVYSLLISVLNVYSVCVAFTAVAHSNVKCIDGFCSTGVCLLTVDLRQVIKYPHYTS